MKKNIIALMVPAMLAAGAANADVTLVDNNDITLATYGKVAVEMVKDDAVKDGDREYGFEHELGFKAEATVAPMVKAFGGVEFEGTQDEAFADEASAAFMGVKHATYGSLKFGKDGKATDMMTDLVDVFEFSGSIDSTLASAEENFRTFAYEGSFAGANVAVDFVDVEDENVVRLATSYPLTFGATHVLPVVSYEDIEDAASTLALGTGVAHGDFYTAFNFSKTKADHGDIEVNNLDLLAQYTIDKITVRGAFQQVDPDGVEATKIWKAEADYALTKNAKAFVGYEINDTSDDNKLGAGVKLTW